MLTIWVQLMLEGRQFQAILTKTGQPHQRLAVRRRVLPRVSDKACHAAQQGRGVIRLATVGNARKQGGRFADVLRPAPAARSSAATPETNIRS